jgi:ABC-2 type transport system ATP-binding protein
MTSPAIRTTGLGRDFGTVRALDDVTLEVPRGIIFGFLGPNGSGKTTTIRLLLGLLDPTRGTAEVLGYDTRSNAAAIRQRSGITRGGVPHPGGGAMMSDAGTVAWKEWR